MTTVEMNLPDDLVDQAANAGLLSAEAIEAMLREQLRRTAGQALKANWRRAPQAPITPALEQEIVDAVREVRAARSSMADGGVGPTAASTSTRHERRRCRSAMERTTKAIDRSGD
ncbi:MAG: hypothetical protein ABI589_11125 [Burkholderiales bacterium]